MEDSVMLEVVVVMVVVITDGKELDDGGGGVEVDDLSVLSVSRIGVSIQELNCELADDEPPNAAAPERDVGNRFTNPGWSFKEPSSGTGGRKSVWGRWGWRVKAMATEVVAAAACRGAWMRGAQMTGVWVDGVGAG